MEGLDFSPRPESPPHGSDVTPADHNSPPPLLSLADRTTSPASPATSSADQHLPEVVVADFKTRAAELVARTGHPDHFNSGDLARLIDDPKITGQDAITLATLYEIALPSDRGLLPLAERHPINSQSQIADIPLTATAFAAKMSELGAAGLTPEQLRAEGQSLTLENVYRRSILTMEPVLQQKAAAPVSAALYADSKNPLNSIKIQDVHQGSAGDCYFEAALAETAKQNPAIIRDSIHANANGTYTVTFKGDKAHPVTVTQPTEAELALYNGGSPDGMWAPIMEKAFARYCVDVLKRPTSGLTNEDAAAGGDAYDAVKLLTGHTISQTTMGALARSPEADPVIVPEAQISAKISAALAGGRVVVLGTTDDAETVAGLTDSHTYSIVGYQPGPDGGQVTLRNPDTVPWAGGEIKVVNMDTMYRMAAAVDIETRAPETERPFNLDPAR